MSEDNEKLAAAIERLADESAKREADYRTIVEKLTPPEPKPQAEQDAQAVLDGLRQAGVAPAAAPGPTEAEAFLAELKDKNAAQWSSSPEPTEL